MPHPTPVPNSFKSALPPVALITSVFLLNFISRVTFSPLMPAIKNDLGLTHAQAGHVFLAVGLGACIGLILSGFIAKRLRHRRTIILSSFGIGIILFSIPFCESAASLKFSVLAMAVCAGTYLPSGIAAVTSLTRPQDWGKAISVHEAAPNLSFFLAPLYAELVLTFFSWRTAMMILGIANLVIACIFCKFGKGGDFPGEAPRPSVLKQLVRRPVFWLLAGMFSAAVGTSLGPYSMLPLFLADVHGYERESANHLLSLSRFSGIFMSFFAGWVTDRLGVRKTMGAYFILAGTFTICLGIFTNNLLVAAVLAQPMISVCFFPAAFTAISIFFDAPIRSTAVSLITPLSALVGVGLIPALIGRLGDAGLFHVGFIGLGCLPLACLALLPLLRMKKGEWEEVNMPED